MTESVGGDVLGQVLQAIQILSEQVKGLGDRMDRMEARMETQQEWLQRLVLDDVETRNGVNQARRELQSEIMGIRTELRTELRSDLHAVRMELQLGLHQVHARIDRTNDSLFFLRGMGLYRAMG